MKGPRGGGKSKLLSALAFCLWYYKNLDGLDMGGSLEQAKVVYNYFHNYCTSNESVKHDIDGEITITQTKSKEGKYFKCVAASPKQVRGPHPNFLLIDEACEVKDELIKDALPMVDSSDPSIVVITSTFHKIFGIFQEIWDHAEELGYMRFSWDIIDVAKKFDPKIFDDPELREQIPDLDLLIERIAGRTGDVEGWVPIENVIQAWREKPSLDWFDVEYMGSRPSASGLVLNPEDVDYAFFDEQKETKYNYSKGAECIGGLDWGFSGMTSFVALMRHKDDVKCALQNKNYTQVRSEVIIRDILESIKRFGIKVIYADISHKFENADLKHAIKKAREDDITFPECRVVEVPFNKEKEGMLGNFRAHFERRKTRFPSHMIEAKWQFKRYRYQENSDKPMKKDDHIPDATMLALSHWPLGKRISNIMDARLGKPSTITKKEDEEIMNYYG